MTESPQLGRIYTGKVVRITDFGAFIEIIPGVDGMVHISQLDSERVEKVEDVVRMGDEVTVMVTGIDENGKIRLSRQAVLGRLVCGGSPGTRSRRQEPQSGRVADQVDGVVIAAHVIARVVTAAAVVVSTVIRKKLGFYPPG